jgi:hypothetical protein
MVRSFNSNDRSSTMAGQSWVIGSFLCKLLPKT